VSRPHHPAQAEVEEAPAADAADSRRGFLRRLSGWVLAPLALVGALPGVVALLDPLRRDGARDWASTGVAASALGAEPVRITWRVAAGWEQRGRVGYVRRDHDALVALSSRCTHAGCTVHPDANGFACPCHGGRFGPDGAPIAGPVSRPLERLECRERSGVIEVRETGA